MYESLHHNPGAGFSLLAFRQTFWPVFLSKNRSNYPYCMKRWLPIFWALHLLVCTSGLAMRCHYCCGELVSVAFFGPAPGCAAMEAPDSCEQPTGTGYQSRSCCQDQLVAWQADLDQQPEKIATPELQPSATGTLVTPIALVQLQPSALGHSALCSAPPLRQQDRQVWYQVYRL